MDSININYKNRMNKMDNLFQKVLRKKLNSIYIKNKNSDILVLLFKIKNIPLKCLIRKLRLNVTSEYNVFYDKNVLNLYMHEKKIELISLNYIYILFKNRKHIFTNIFLYKNLSKYIDINLCLKNKFNYYIIQKSFKLTNIFNKFCSYITPRLIKIFYLNYNKINNILWFSVKKKRTNTFVYIFNQKGKLLFKYTSGILVGKGPKRRMPYTMYQVVDIGKINLQKCYNQLSKTFFLNKKKEFLVNLSYNCISKINSKRIFKKFAYDKSIIINKLYHTTNSPYGGCRLKRRKRKRMRLRRFRR
jgi:ribosomal protein S11